MTGFTEDELVAVLRKILSGEAPGVVVGPGDDAALVEIGMRVAVLTTDMLVEGIHFDLRTTGPRDLGYKALVVNVSDVAAMGGSPRFGLVGLGLPSAAEGSWVVELYGGLREAADEYAMAVVGGDTSRSDRIVVSVTVTGEVPRGGGVMRSGARPGDRVVVTGRLGAAAGGLRLTQAPSQEVSSILASQWARDLVSALLRPVARVGEGQTLAGAGARAMMDLSDGLAKDVGRLCRESGVGVAIRLADVPVAPELDDLKGVLAVDPLELALTGGEDYELVAALPPEAVEPARVAIRDRFGTALTDIGEITVDPGVVGVEPDGSTRPLEGGWNHFAS